jgi:hypothetical protein
MAAIQQRFTLRPIFEADYPILTSISIAAFQHNSRFYLSYPSTVESHAIESYTSATKVKFAEEGNEIRTIKITDGLSPEKKIVGFAFW